MQGFVQEFVGGVFERVLFCFGYYGGMPKLNLKNPEVEKFITDVACYWIKECNIDGWRMDVGDEISHYFWKNFRRAVKAVKNGYADHWRNLALCRRFS